MRGVMKDATLALTSGASLNDAILAFYMGGGVFERRPPCSTGKVDIKKKRRAHCNWRFPPLILARASWKDVLLAHTGEAL